jgi:nucleolar protein 4
LLGRTINCEWAIPKSQFENLKKDKAADDNIESVENNNVERKSTSKFSKKNEISKAELRKLNKIRKRKKRSRIIIRNLPFTVREESINEHFKKYGNIEEITILKKPDGTSTGCCFLQFDRVQSAAQTIHYENAKTFEGRTIIIDWAMPKDKFEKSNENINCSTEEDGNGEVLIKNENENEIKIKEENISDEDEFKDEINSDQEKDDDSSSDKLSNNNSDDDIQSVDDKKDINLELDVKSPISNPRRISNDVNEGKTVFIKNVPFSATNEDLKTCMLQFGPVYYALICIDQLTEHSKGTAFVKFRVIFFIYIETYVAILKVT